jgi:hypothetical protein
VREIWYRVHSSSNTYKKLRSVFVLRTILHNVPYKFTHIWNKCCVYLALNKDFSIYVYSSTTRASQRGDPDSVSGSSCRICGGYSGIGASYSRSTSGFPLPLMILPMLHTHLSAAVCTTDPSGATVLTNGSTRTRGVLQLDICIAQAEMYQDLRHSLDF